jgi:hypothetical protein
MLQIPKLWTHSSDCRSMMDSSMKENDHWITERGGESSNEQLYHLLILLTTIYIPLTYSTMFISSSSIYYCIININIHQCIINNNKHIHTIHSTPIFTWKPNAGENHIIIFLYVKNYIQGSTNFQFSGSN